MKTKLLILLIALFTAPIFSQTKLADKFFGNYAYVKASELYEKAYEDGDESLHVLTRLGDCYYNNSNSKQAVKWYSKAVEKHTKTPAEYLFKYIQALKSLGNYNEANNWTKNFNERYATENKKQTTLSTDSYTDLLSSKKNEIIEIINLPLNSDLSDFGSFIYNDKLYFASSKNATGSGLYEWTKEPFLDLFQIDVKENESKLEFGTQDAIKASNINTDYHEASVAISKDGKTLYFTRDNVTRKNNLNYDRKGTTHLKIYKATLIDGIWKNIKELPFNDNVYSTGHPALSIDNKKLYFVSDREGGFGGTDIYEVDILKNNKYSKPKNLGNKINTLGREMFPFISKDSTFYFSSDGHLNIGLLDIFKSNFIKNPNAKPKNLGKPYNSGYDDFAFFIDSDKENKRGYFSSNRPGGKGNDDIYSFSTYECSQVINGVARNKDTNAILPNTKVRLINESGKIINEVSTNQEGFYTFNVDCNKKYIVIGSKQDFLDDKIELVLGKEHKNIISANLFLAPLIKNNKIVINPIFFDFDKWNIRTDAEYELEKVIDVLRSHPKMIIKIESHTDSRGSAKYNLKLSNKRAESSNNYIISRGIDSKRIISAKGFGENKLLNNCTNGIKCSDEEHQLNRRTDFIIVKKN